MKATGKALKDAKVSHLKLMGCWCLKLHPPKTDMIIKQEPFEDVSLTNIGDFPAGMFVFGGVWHVFFVFARWVALLKIQELSMRLIEVNHFEIPACGGKMWTDL